MMMLKTLRGKKRRAHQLLDTAIGEWNWNTPHYSSWHKKQYGSSLTHWKKQDFSFIGNKALFLAHQGQNKGYTVGTVHANAYDELWYLAFSYYCYTNPLVDPGPMRPFFLTELLVCRLHERIDKKPPRDIQERVWFYQRRAIFLQYLHALGLDRGPIHRIDTAPLDYQDH
jgi:hypothetical protein